MRRKLHLLGPATFAAALLPAAHAAAPKPCDLLSRQTAESVFGAPLAKSLPPNALACIYYNNADSALVNLNVISLEGIPPGTQTTVLTGSVHKEYATDVVDSVPGLGEGNNFTTSVTSTSRKDTLHVVYHNTLVTLIVAGSTNPKLRQAMIDVMKQALAKF